jgi:hypothetical protein
MKKYAFILIISILLGCCKDEPNCTPNMETKAYFEGYNTERLKDWIDIRYPLIETDTNWRWMTFVAKDIENAISYKWIIGAEEIENQSTVTRNGFPLNTPIPIALIVKKTPNKACFPNDDGIDTLTKSYYFTDKRARFYRTNGTFLTIRGSYEHKPKDTLTIRMTTNKSFDNNDIDTIYDFPCIGDKILYEPEKNAYNSFYGNAGIGGQKYKCDTLTRFSFSYKKTGNGVYMKYFKIKKKPTDPLDSVIFHGYELY